MNTEDKVRATIKEIKTRRNRLEKQGLCSLDMYTTFSFVIEVLQICLVDWIPKSCLQCKKTTVQKSSSKKLTTISVRIVW